MGLENLLPEGESILIALVAKGLAQLRRSTVEDCDLSTLLILDLLEDLVPVRTSGICAGLQASDQISFFLQDKLLKSLAVPPQY